VGVFTYSYNQLVNYQPESERETERAGRTLLVIIIIFISSLQSFNCKMCDSSGMNQLEDGHHPLYYDLEHELWNVMHGKEGL